MELIYNRIKEFFDKYKEESNLKKAIVGISAGKDSTVTAMLLVDFLGKENVYGVLMPNGIQKDIKDSYLVVEKLGIKNFEINLEKTELALLDELNRNVNILVLLIYNI